MRQIVVDRTNGVAKKSSIQSRTQRVCRTSACHVATTVWTGVVRLRASGPVGALIIRLMPAASTQDAWR